MMGEFRRASNDFRSTIENEVEAEKIRDSLRIEPPSVEPVSPARALPAETGPAEPEAPAPVVEPAADAVSREGGPSSAERQ
jgi:hypothetical protein